jgi:hypothetical protein
MPGSLQRYPARLNYESVNRAVNSVQDEFFRNDRRADLAGARGWVAVVKRYAIREDYAFLLDAPLVQHEIHAARSGDKLLQSSATSTSKHPALSGRKT